MHFFFFFFKPKQLQSALENVLYGLSLKCFKVHGIIGPFSRRDAEGLRKSKVEGIFRKDT